MNKEEIKKMKRKEYHKKYWEQYKEKNIDKLKEYWRKYNKEHKDRQYRYIQRKKERNRQMKEVIDILIKDIETNIDSYCGDYGTLEYGVQQTFEKILIILKVMNGKELYEGYFEELIRTYSGGKYE